ncbi:MAG: hypothetical protein N3C12_12225 [Candidatus Binatia bacterium]|nr:hypothetical protein [Candidatus Binatia bacterium]
MKRWLRIVAGSALVVVGTVGLFLPFLQGILFIVVGLSLLSSESERVRRLQEWLHSRWGQLRARNREEGKSAHGV